MKSATALVTAVLVAVGLAGCGGGGPHDSDAEVMCERAIRDSLVGDTRLSGTTSIVEKESDNAVRWRVSGNATGTNALGGPAEGRWYCVAIWTDSEGYEIVDAGLVN